MRIFITILTIALVMLQYRLLLSDRGMHEVSRLQAAIEVQRDLNRDQSERNRQLGAEVANLKNGMAALEERARSELGMVGNNETFYQVVAIGTPPPPAPARPVTARAQ
jgi:cell division protein FtsB